MVTIKDIAKAAGVSHGTVSNVLNKNGKVSIDKIRLVEETASRLGYVPNIQAQKLRQQSASTIVVILPNLRESGYLDLFTVLQRCFFEKGFDVQVYTTSDIPGQEELILEQVSRSGLGAVISISCLRENLCDCYKNIPCPVVYLNRRPEYVGENASFISFDFYQIGADLAAYALEKDYRQISLFSPPRFFHDGAQLFAGFSSRMDGREVHWHTSDMNLAINKAFDMITHEDTDLIVVTDSIRVDALEVALRISGKKRPDILMLDSCRIFPNNLVQVCQLNYSKMGMKVAKLLLSKIEHNTPLPTELMLPRDGLPLQSSVARWQEKRFLSMLTLDTPSASALQLLSPLLEEETGITLRITNMQYDDLLTQVNMLNQEYTYDLIRIDVASLDKLGSQAFRPLSQIGMSIENLPEGLIDSTSHHYTMRGDLFCAMPFDPSVQILLYRTDLFENATLKRAFYEAYHKNLSVPQTIEEYLTVAEFFTQSFNPDSPTQYGTAVTSGTAATAACDFLPFYLSNSNTLGIADSPQVFSTPQMQFALEQYKKLSSEYSVECSWWRDSAKMFSEGRIAMLPIFSNHAAYIINSKYSNVVGKMSASFLPGNRPLLGGGVIGVSRYSRNTDTCKDFFRWYYTDNVSAAMVRLGGTSPLLSAYNNAENAAIFPWLSVAKRSFSVGVRGMEDRISNTTFIRDYEYVLGTAVRNAISGSLSPQDALRIADHMYLNIRKNG